VPDSTLTVVMPVHNEAPHLEATIDALVAAVARSDFATDLVLVDDGSTDGSGDVVERALARRLPFRLVPQENRGRFAARRAGVEAASGEFALLLDGRVRLHPDALAFVNSRVAAGEHVWTSHVHVEDGGNPFGVFWRLIAELAWAEYFEHPRTTSFGTDDFDRFPKGTTCFLAPRSLLIDAMDSFQSRYADFRRVNDDTPLIRWIAERLPIHVSPAFSSFYRPRTSFWASMRHAFHRGVVFVDGHGREESRFFPAVVAFFPVSALLALAALRRPIVVPFTTAAISVAAAGLGIVRRRRPLEIASLGLVAPLYAVAHGGGMWRGLLLFSPRASGLGESSARQSGSPPRAPVADDARR
jgi:glycosyltransferase involved in cell wall biosynthesis